MANQVARRVVFAAAASAAMLVVVAGCGDKKKLAKVSGVVKLDGKALDGATVVFHPADGGRPANGLTGADGHFTLTTYTSGDGAQVGEHKVVITKSNQPEIVAPSANDPKLMQEAMKDHDARRKAEAAKPKPAVIPASYGDLQKTPLKAVVPAEGDIEFSLRSAGGT